VAVNGETSFHIYTDESKQEQCFGSVAVILKGSEMFANLQFKLDNKCPNIQAQQSAILKAFEKLEAMNKQRSNPIRKQYSLRTGKSGLASKLHQSRSLTG